MKVVGYLFADSEGAGNENIDWQRQNIADFAAGLGVRVVRFYHELEGNATEPFVQRSEAKRLLHELENGDIVVVMQVSWVLSSVSDSLLLIHELVRRNVSLYSLDLNENLTLPSPRQLKVYEGAAALVLHLLSALEKNDRGGHAESIRVAKQKMKNEGKYLGGPVPFGWRINGSYLVRDGEQQRIIREIQKLKGARWSYRNIARKLKEQYDVNLSHEGVRKVFLKSTVGKDCSSADF